MEAAALEIVDTGARNIQSPGLWVAFLAAVFLMLWVDLHFSKAGKAENFREAMGWSVFWIVLSVAFGGFLWFSYGGASGLEFFAGYLLEKSLSVDNLFVFVLIFQALAIPPGYQHRVLFWGVLGALVLRGTLIIFGVAMVQRFHWLIMVFGVILVFTAIKLAFSKDHDEEAPVESWLTRLLRRYLPFKTTIDGPEFFVRVDGRIVATPLLLAVAAAESADLVFALDSIPAVFAVTDDSFLVFSSNVCALLGLRALYFVVRNALAKLRYLKPGLAGILLFVGVKMLVERWFPVRTGTSIVVIGAILLVAILASLFIPARDDA